MTEFPVSKIDVKKKWKNAKFVKRKLNPEKGHRYLPYIVVLIDEFADLIAGSFVLGTAPETATQPQIENH